METLPKFYEDVLLKVKYMDVLNKECYRWYVAFFGPIRGWEVSLPDGIGEQLSVGETPVEWIFLPE